MESSHTPQCDTSTSNATPQSTQDSSLTTGSKKEQTYPTWGYCRINGIAGATKRMIMCLYCDKVFGGGGINRFKQYLAGIKGEVEGCKKVHSDVRYEMPKSIERHTEKEERHKSLQRGKICMAQASETLRSGFTRNVMMVKKFH